MTLKNMSQSMWHQAEELQEKYYLNDLSRQSVEVKDATERRE